MYRYIVVDDERAVRSGIIRLIGSIKPGYQLVGEAGNGSDGIALALEQRPDLIISDIRMPGMDGIQMLDHLRREELPFQAIILSGYADFDYAREAIKLGVSDYLLKPIDVDSLRTLLDQLEWSRAREQGATAAETPVLLRGLLLGSLGEGEPGYDTALRELTGYRHLAVCYFHALNQGQNGGQAADSKPGQNRAVDHFHQQIAGDLSGRGLTLALHERQAVAVLHNGIADGEWDSLLPARAPLEDSLTIIAASCPLGDGDPSGALNDCRKLLRWSLALGNSGIITGERIRAHTVEPFSYPEEVERALIQTLYAGDLDAALACTDDFLSRCRDTRYHPSDLLDAWLSLFSTVITQCRTMESPGFRYVNQSELLEQLVDCYFLGEMHSLLQSLLRLALQRTGDRYSLPVKKAMRYATEHYSEALTLDQVASSLGITPVYLSSLFSKETGQSFLSYLTGYRINRAKELLLAGEYKIYEIARMVGYSDAKYFCKVFKKNTGMSASAFSAATGRSAL